MRCGGLLLLVLGVLPCVVAISTSVTVEILKRRCIGASSETCIFAPEPSQFFNVHSGPGTVDDWNQKEVSKFLSYGDSLGRSFEVTWVMSQSREDPQRPGYVDVPALTSFCTAHQPVLGKWPLSHVRMIDAGKPEMYYPGTGKGFIPGSHNASAEFWAVYLQACTPYTTGVSPVLITEVANEIGVHLEELNTTYEEVIALHVAIAERVHTLPDSPTKFLIGGPTSAWPEWQLNDFGYFKERMGAFIDGAGHAMDFLSVHLYDTYQGPDAMDPNDYDPRTGNNVDAILDLHEAYAASVLGHSLPHVISEFGSGFKSDDLPYDPLHDWFIIRGVVGKMMQFLDRPDRILKAIPFIVGKARWWEGAHPYPYTLWHNETTNGTETWTFTHLEKLYRSLAWFAQSGQAIRHLVTSSSTADIQVQALYFPSCTAVAYIVMVNNLANTSVDVALKMDDLPRVISFTDERLRFDKQKKEPVIETSNRALPPAHITLAGEEFAVLSILTAFGPPLTTVLESTYHAAETITNITGKKQSFAVPVNATTAPCSFAYIRLSFAGHLDVYASPPVVTLNGVRCPVNPETMLAGRVHVGKTGEAFGSLRIPVPHPASTLAGGGEAQVTVQFPTSGGFIPSVVLVVGVDVPGAQFDGAQGMDCP